MHMCQSDEGLRIMDTLLHTFKDFFLSCFARTCTAIKFIIIRMFTCHTTQPSVPFVYNKCKNDHSFLKYEKNRHATCLFLSGSKLVEKDVGTHIVYDFNKAI